MIHMLTNFEANEEYKGDHETVWINRYLDFILREVGFSDVKDLKVLDLGCGRGDILENLKNKGAEVQGIEIDKFMLSVSKKKGIPVRKLDLEKDKFPFKDESFDLIISDMVLEHVYNPHIFMNESKRVLKKGGFMVHRTVNWKHEYKTFFDGLDHVKPYTEATMKQLFDIHELETVKIYPRFGHFKILWRYFDWAWGRRMFSPTKLNLQLLGIAKK